MAKLQDVINQLILNNNTAEETNSLIEIQTTSVENTVTSVQSLTDAIRDQIVLMQANSLDDIERQRELINSIGGLGTGGGGRRERPSREDAAPAARGILGTLGSIIVAPITDLLKMIGSGLSPILSPLKLLGRIVMRGGPLGLVLTALYAVFHDIGDNPKLKETIDSLKAIWFDRLLPTFESIRDTFNSIVSSEGAQTLFTDIGVYWENLKLTVQDTFLNLVTIVGELVGDFADGIGQMVEGDFLGGLGTILRGMFDAVLGLLGEGVKLLLGALGFDREQVGTMVDTVTSTIKFVLDNFGLLVDLLGAQFDYTFTWIENGFKKTVAKIKGFFSTLGDKIYLMIAENLRFTFPTIELPLPDWAQTLGAPSKFTLINGFEAGIDSQKIEATRASIAQSETATQAEVSRLDAETATKLQELEDLKGQLAQNFMQQVIVANQPAAAPAGGGGGAPSIIMPPVPTNDRLSRGDRLSSMGY
jgi:hypothetical protein